jgi:uncharacterized protein YjiS (DUF1127 family)
MCALRVQAAKHTKQDRLVSAAGATQAHGTVRPQQAAPRRAASLNWTTTMLFLELYGVPCAQPEAPRSDLALALKKMAKRVAKWQRAASDRRILARMTISQLDDLQLSWPDDFRNIKAHS